MERNCLTRGQGEKPSDNRLRVDFRKYLYSNRLLEGYSRPSEQEASPVTTERKLNKETGTRGRDGAP